MTFCIFLRTFVAWWLFSMMLAVLVVLLIGAHGFAATLIGFAFGLAGVAIGTKKFFKEYNDAW